MKHYRLTGSLRAMSISDRLQYIDWLFSTRHTSPEERRALLMNHEQLAAALEFFVFQTPKVEDSAGRDYTPLRGGKRAYDRDEFMAYLRQHPRHLQRLTWLVREALFSRFSEDAAAAWR